MIPVKRLVMEIENSPRISLTRNEREPRVRLPVGECPGLSGIIECGNRLLLVCCLSAIGHAI